MSYFNEKLDISQKQKVPLKSPRVGYYSLKPVRIRIGLVSPESLDTSQKGCGPRFETPQFQGPAIPV
jgi:hypothetical protein